MRKTLIRVLPTLAAVAAFSGFMRLGFWQLHRAHEAEAQKQAYERRVDEAPARPGGGVWSAQSLLYRRVAVTGHYDAPYQILWDNRFSHGAVGYDVLTPLRLSGSQEHVLVDRGWVPFTGNHAQTPSVAVPGGVQRVLGLAVRPGAYFRLGRPQPTHPWHRLWEYLNLDRYAQAVPFPVEPVEVLLTPGTGPLVQTWPKPGTGVNMHRGYALQWFLFAFTVVVVYVVLNRPGRGKHERA